MPLLNNGSQSLTTACDIYSFGVLLWEMVTGKIPWDNFEDKEIQKNDFMDKHRVIIENNIIKDIIEDCCKKEQKKRPGALSLIDRINKK
jgi:sterile alpha motif and leucine zipper-containing kinase AZK